MNEQAEYVFHGDQRRQSEKRHPDAPDKPEPYIASEELVKAVRLAIYLKRPLLLEGEAGCGKTRLAHAVAYELGLPIYTWHVRSGSKAEEGFYSYDSLLRLHDVQVSRLNSERQANGLSNEGDRGLRDPEDPKDYLKFGPLGKAFMVRDCPAVLLIDEIDKADVDFPNDLLSVLDDPWKFSIKETGEEIEASKDNRPIIFITSNKEKGNLPAPFLRRCIYYFLEFPKESLGKIIDAHYETKKTEPPTPELMGAAVSRFLKLRNEGGLHKNPGTSEFLDWLEALRAFDSKPYDPERLLKGGTIPYPELLLKRRDDWRLDWRLSGNTPAGL